MGFIFLFSYGAIWLAFSVGFWAGRGGQGGCFFKFIFGFFPSFFRTFVLDGGKKRQPGIGGLGGKKDCVFLWMDTLFA